ncbi:MAG: hypothetical protein ACXWC4_01390 [Telluria sp.]
MTLSASTPAVPAKTHIPDASNCSADRGHAWCVAQARIKRVIGLQGYGWSLVCTG